MESHNLGKPPCKSKIINSTISRWATMKLSRNLCLFLSVLKHYFEKSQVHALPRSGFSPFTNKSFIDRNKRNKRGELRHPLTLRGGAICGAISKSIAKDIALKGTATVHCAQGILAVVDPETVAENYFEDSSPQSLFLVRVLVANVFTWVGFAVLTFLCQDDTYLHKAMLALGLINTLDVLRTFLNGDISRCGLDRKGQVFMLITPLIAAFAGLARASWAHSYFKAFMGIYILDGIVASMKPSLTASVFFDDADSLSDESLIIMKNAGWWVFAVSVSGMALAYNVKPLQAMGYGMAIMTLAGVDLILRTSQKKLPLLFWTIIDAIVACVLLSKENVTENT